MAPVEQLISVEEYLARETKPASEYEDGVVWQKPMASWKHGVIQQSTCQLINLGRFSLKAASEINCRIREGKYLVPDVIAQRRDAIQDPYPIEPVALCVEILSPGDLMSETIAKCEAYHGWGVPMTWILDPEMRQAWHFRRGERLHELPPDGFLEAEDLRVAVADVFAALDN